jgi:hypothetical protein
MDLWFVDLVSTGAERVVFLGGFGDWQFFKLEDVAMGMWIQKYKKWKPKQVDYISNDLFVHMGCEADYVIAHYQNPGQMQCLWQLAMKQDFTHCCETVDI